MELKSKILSSELEFRKYIIQNRRDIKRIFICEDSLDNLIYFYCFANDNVFVATKEQSAKKMASFIKTYLKLSFELKYCFVLKIQKDIALELINPY